MEFACGLLLGLLASTAYLVVELQKLKDDRADVLRRIIDAFTAGVAVNLAKSPETASAELFRSLRQRPSNNTIHESHFVTGLSEAPPAKIPRKTPEYFEGSIDQFQFSGGGGASSELEIPGT